MVLETSTEEVTVREGMCQVEMDPGERMEFETSLHDGLGLRGISLASQDPGTSLLSKGGQDYAPRLPLDNLCDHRG